MRLKTLCLILLLSIETMLGFTYGPETDSLNVKPGKPQQTTPLISSPPAKDHSHKKSIFSPDSDKAVWWAALFPGLGQIYNRKYWKLPILYGGFLGVYYGLNWNNQNLTDYSTAYIDLLDNDPATNSYLDLMPPGTTEASINKSWLEGVLKRRKDYFRRNRDLCIISMVGVYAIGIIDAYIDAQLFHFDISPNLSLDIAPSVLPNGGILKQQAYGLQFAFRF